jgi:AcrR family transcriptional regulator
VARSDSRERILDAAERLYAERGLRATSLREIAAAAKANTGSIYFHFKTKAELTREVFRRRLAPLDAERMARLEACQRQAAPDAPRPREILEALIEPLARLTRGGGGGLHFLGVLGRTYSEPDPEIIRMLEQDHDHTLDRFREALAAALPDLPRDQLALRFHFALGSVAHTLGSDVTWRMLSGGKRPGPGAWQRVLDELLPFLVAGFEAPRSGADARPARRVGAA